MLLDHRTDVNAQGRVHGNALQAAAYQGDEATVKLLLDRGADVNAQGGKYGNALQAAAAATHWENAANEATAKILLDRGADVNAQGGVYGNALQAAAYWGDEATVKILLDRGADCTIQPLLSDRLSLLHNAIRSTRTSILRQLLSHGASIHLASTDDSGQTPLHLAVRSNHSEMARCLLDAGASPDETDFTDMSVLQSAIQAGNHEIVHLLYPRARNSLFSLVASNWRNLFRPFSRCDIEVIDSEVAKLSPVDNLKEQFYQLSYPLPSFLVTRASAGQNHFMQQHRSGTRML